MCFPLNSVGFFGNFRRAMRRLYVVLGEIFNLILYFNHSVN